jgi:hypothetical protein
LNLPVFEIRTGHGSRTISFFSSPLARLLPPLSAAGAVRLLRVPVRLQLRTPPPLVARRRHCLPAARILLPYRRRLLLLLLASYCPARHRLLLLLLACCCPSPPPPLSARLLLPAAVPRAPRRRLAGEDASVTFNISNSAFQHFHASNFNICLYMFNILMSNVEHVYEKY